MRQRPEARELAHALLPVVMALVLLVAAWRWVPSSAIESPGGVGLQLVWTLIAAAAALYGPAGLQTLGLGSLSLPPLIASFGLVRAGILAALAVLLASAGRRFLFASPRRRLRSPSLLAPLADAARVVVATVAAGWVLRPGLPESGIAMPLTEAMGRALLATGVYVLVPGLCQWLEWRDFGTSGDGWPTRFLRTSLISALGWLLGVALMAVLGTTGQLAALVPAVAIAGLAEEAARNVHLRQRALQRAAELWEVTKAGHRIIFRGPDLAGMAAHVLAECRQVLPFHWFQFELLGDEASGSGWCAGPDGALREGSPEPADSPPALPGIHRRASWRVLQRQLKGDGKPIAVMRLWCDPRRIDSASIELLDSLLPQIAAAVHRALLDRRAKQDALTGLADRRVLGAHLQEAFTRSIAEGSSLAVIMCDVDHFKKINDEHGHDVGDEALKRVAELLEEHRRDSDLCSRYGGEEFTLVLEQTDGETALGVAERLRRAVEESAFAPAGERIALRLSAGVAAFPELQVREGKDLLVLADEALIEAKKRGRNRSLLNLGRSRYRRADGTSVGPGEDRPELKAPTLFS